MRWNIEIQLSPAEIAQRGKEETLKHTRLRAWSQAIHERQPKRSLMLLSEEEGQRYDIPFLLLRFAIDE